MAKKLRWHKVRHNAADGVTASNNGARMKNESGQDMHIRQIHVAAALSTAGIAENAQAQLSTQNTFADNDDEAEFRIEARLGSNGGAADDTMFMSDHWYFDRGQLSLEPGESLFSSILKSSGGAASVPWLIGYELEE